MKCASETDKLASQKNEKLQKLTKNTHNSINPAKAGGIKENAYHKNNNGFQNWIRLYC
jgi:hypothetical protein